MTASLKRLLIANRGEIASRILRTARRLGFQVLCIYVATDAASPHAVDADEAYSVTSYTDIGAIIDLVRQHNVDFVIPGYGFLSENADFATAVQAAGAVFVGPAATHIMAFGIKHEARALAAQTGVPTCPGSGLLDSEDAAAAAAAEIGFPVMLKATAGGGGMGLQICHDETQVRASFSSVVSRGSALFANGGVFLERFYPVSRHIEVQVFGDGRGDCIVLGERECSIQRRHQKVLEEAPSPFLETHPALRQKLFAVSRQLGRHIGYRSAGTIEYLVDDATGDFFFLEMNTRLQVEHGITELRFGIDLVELMLRLADGSMYRDGGLDAYRGLVPSGHAIEARVYAENPLHSYMPSPGVLQEVHFPGSSHEGPVRVDTWVRTGTTVSLAFDPMLAKVMACGATREEATARLRHALKETRLRGTVTNRDLLVAVLEAPDFVCGRTTTDFLDGFRYSPQVLEVVAPGSYTTVQDYPGRVGVGSGIPQGGPMDVLHAQLANVLVGNPAGTAHLEITLVGPTLRFHAAAVIAVAGALAPDMRLSDGTAVPMYAAVAIPADTILTVGKLEGGSRAYLAIRGGLPSIPFYLASQATSPIAGIGGLQGRPLAAGDQLDLVDSGVLPAFKAFALPRELVPNWDRSIVYCLSGPHDSTDILTPTGLQAFYDGEWAVSHQASRVGVRLQGPPAQWARATGGAGGAHPSNYIDYPYAVGALNWTGDSAVLFPADAPSLGGFVSSHVVPSAELAKVAQLRPGDRFRFVPIRLEAALALRQRQVAFLQSIAAVVAGTTDASSVIPLSLAVVDNGLARTDTSQAVLATVGKAVLRQAGDAYVLIEFGQSLDLKTRCCVQNVAERVEQASIQGVRLITAIGCSLLVEYDAFELPQADLVRTAVAILEGLTAEAVPPTLASRIVRLPMVFDDAANRAAVERYMQTQRASAAYLPDPVTFIARANGLRDKDAVRRSVLASRVLVVGVGFFNGTPIGLPLDPRCRLSVPKFNPPRTFSPAGGLGFGGSFVTCDPIDAPGGYVNFGRTLPGWDQFAASPSFVAGGRPWLFRNFDQIEFYEVTEHELEALYARFRAGQFVFDIRPAVFDVAAHAKFCESVADETAAFLKRQEAAAAEEIAREKSLLSQWQAEQLLLQTSAKDALPSLDDIDDALKIKAQTHASVYKIPAQKGATVAVGDVLLVLEAMKMEINFLAAAEYAGRRIANIVVGPNDIVQPGDTMIVLEQQ